MVIYPFANDVLTKYILVLLIVTLTSHEGKMFHSSSRADPEVGDRGSRPPPGILAKSGYQIRDWDRFDISQHLCKLQS